MSRALLRCDAPELALTAYAELGVGHGASGSGFVQLEFEVSVLLILFVAAVSYANLLCHPVQEDPTPGLPEGDILRRICPAHLMDLPVNRNACQGVR